MPKPENPGSHGKGHGKGKQTIFKWLDKGWECVIISKGESDAAEIQLQPETESITIFGQMFDKDGRKLKHKPHVTVEETATGAVISTASPVAEDTHILYEVVEDEDEDEDELDEPVLL